MKVGSIVKTVLPPIDDIKIKGSVDPGALAIVVDGQKEFPALYNQLEQQVGAECMDEFIWIEWVKDDPRYFGRFDGAYAKCRFSNTRVVSSRVIN